MSRVRLRYDVDLSQDDSFFLLADKRTIRANIGEALSRRYVVEIELRRQKMRMDAPRALHVRPLDSELETWIVESSVVHPNLARMEILLTCVPASVSWALLQL